MKNNNIRFVLAFDYDSISLYEDINGKITQIPFSNGQNTLSNCVTFSYEKEDLIFLPDGYIFDVNNHSPFSMFIDYAGYHFESNEAVEVILRSLITDKMIPSLKSKEELCVCLRSFYFESPIDNEQDLIEFPKINVEGHIIHFYNIYGIIWASINDIKDYIGDNIIIGYPFLTLIDYDTDTSISFSSIPTIERKSEKDAAEKYPLSNRLPKSLNNTIRSEILYAKLHNKKLPETVIYQNRSIEIAHTEYSEMFDEIIRNDSKIYDIEIESIGDKQILIFDFGMHHVMKDYLLSKLPNAKLVKHNYQNEIDSYLIRNLLILHSVYLDPTFMYSSTYVFKGHEEAYHKINNTKYYRMKVIEDYFRKMNKTNLFKNSETKAIQELKLD